MFFKVLKDTLLVEKQNDKNNPLKHEEEIEVIH